MRIRLGLSCAVCSGLVAAMAAAWTLAASIPPGRQHRLTIDGENTVTFLPQAGLPPIKIDYKAKIEYIINTRYGKDSKPSADEGDEKEAKPPVEPVVPKKAIAKKGGSSSRSKSKDKDKEADNPALRVSGAVDLSLHSTEMTFRQNGQPVLETRMSRSRFQGRLQPESPVMNVAAAEAPLRLQEILKNYDIVAASLMLNDDLKVVNRKYRVEGPQRAVIETILSIHAPIPKDVDSWEAPTQLAMGHGQTAKGKLRFEKDKKAESKPGEPIKVKVSGLLKAEGIVAGNFIKDGRYTVTGTQTYDAHTHEWTSSRWSVEVDNELANQAGLTVAQAKGMMTVESRSVDAAGPSPGESVAPKL